MEGIILSLYSDKEMERVNVRRDFKFLSWSPYLIFGAENKFSALKCILN